uniref:Ion transport domain-containing protein n=1 Tax=Octopus bimaculoides TaxID=37653 RepID=A0A0L8HTU5_OCTBM
MSFIVATHPACQVERIHGFWGRIRSNKTEYLDMYPYVPHPALIIIDFICLAFFSCDLFFRFITCPSRKKFAKNSLNFVDFAALVPDYIEIIAGHTLEVTLAIKLMHYVNFLRIFRALRIFRLVRYVPGLWIMLYTFKASFWDLLLMICFMIVGMIVFATFIYYAEDHNIRNIPLGLWWALITMTTVGYGDVYPTSNVGYLVGSLCAVTGLLMVGFTVPIIVNHFVMYYKHMQSMQQAQKREEKTKKEMDRMRKLIKEEEAETESQHPCESKKEPQNSWKPQNTVKVSVTEESSNQYGQTSLSNPSPPSYEGLSNTGIHRGLRSGMARSTTSGNNDNRTVNGLEETKM